jgi:hypothetical protein
VKVAAHNREAFSVKPVTGSPSTSEVGEGLTIPQRKIGNVMECYTRT